MDLPKPSANKASERPDAKTNGLAKPELAPETTADGKPVMPSKQAADSVRRVPSQFDGSTLHGARKLYVLLCALVGVAFLVLGLSTYVANGLLVNKSKSIASARLKSAVLDRKLEQVAKARADIARYQPLSDIAKDIVPQDKDQAQTVREIALLAAANSIKLGAITFPASSLGDNKTPHSQLKVAKGIPGVYNLEVTVESDGAVPVSYSDLLNFLDALEHNRRTALVEGISIQPLAGKTDQLSFTLTLSEYIKP